MQQESDVPRKGADMSKRYEEFNKVNELATTKARVAGQIVEENDDMVTMKTGGCLFDIPSKSIIGKETASGGMVILSLEPETRIMVRDIMSVEELIGAYSSKIIKDNIKPDTECCECVPTFCVDNTQCVCHCQCQCSDCNILARFRSVKFRRH
jgi:hypothetical protein